MLPEEEPLSGALSSSIVSSQPSYASDQARPAFLHPSAGWDAERNVAQQHNVSWNQPSYTTDLIWDESIGHHVRIPSPDGSYAASSVDDLIRNLPSQADASSFIDPPAVVMARMTGNPPQVHASTRPGPRVHSSPPARPTAPATRAEMPIDTSAFAAPWNDRQAPLHFEHQSSNSYQASFRQAGPTVLVDVTTNVRTPSPRRPFAAHTVAQSTAGPSRHQGGPRMPQPSNQSGERAPSRASVLSYVDLRREERPPQAPIDVDAMDVDDGAPPAFAAPPPAANAPFVAPPPGPQAYNAPPDVAAPPMPAPAPQAAPRQRAPVNLPFLDEHLNAGRSAASGIDWLNADITRAPPAGWRPIQFRSPQDVFKGQSKRQAKRWRELALLSRCCLLHIAGRGGCDGDESAWQSYEIMKELVEVIFGVSRRNLLPPEPESNAPRGSNIAPYFTLVTNLTELQLTTLLGWCWVSTKWISVNFIPFPPPIPSYLATWVSSTAFVSTSPEDAKDMLAVGFGREPLLSATARVIRHDKEAGAAGKWGDTPVVAAFNATVNSIRVRVLPRLVGRENTPSPLYVMYCDPPTTNPADWEDFRDAVKAHSFGIDGGRSPELFQEEGECKICHSIDHTLGLCDLNLVEGWNGPRRDDFSNTQAAPSPRGGKGKQRGGGNNQQRGHGRGRGNGRGGGRPPPSGQRLDDSAKAALMRAAGGGYAPRR